jgi:putative hemolysin
MVALTVAQILALVVLLGLSFFFSSAETAVFSLTPMHLHGIRRHAPRKAAQIEQLLASPTQVLSSVLIGNTLVNVAASDLGYILAERSLPAFGVTLAIPVMAILLILLGEVTPKRLAVRRPEHLALHYVTPLRWLVLLCRPARSALDWLTRSARHHLKPHRVSLTGAELLTAVDVSHEEGLLTKEERKMLDGIIRLENLQATDVMTPRVDLVGIDLNSPPATWPDTARKSRWHYLPVYRGDLDHVEGFLDVPRYLLSGENDLKAATVPHFYVPDTAPLDTLLTSFQQQNRRIAIVIDEYGGTAGLITRGDILDEIAESVRDEFGGKKLWIEPSGPGRWLVDGSVSLEEINYELDLHLEAEGADRIAGWFTAQSGHIPKSSDAVDAQGCRVTVMAMRKHRITTILIEKPEPVEVSSP